MTTEVETAALWGHWARNAGSHQEREETHGFSPGACGAAQPCLPTAGFLSGDFDFGLPVS